MTYKERVWNAFHNKPVDRVPFSFWYHFLEDVDNVDAMKNPELLEQNYQGHKKFIETLQPDFVKVMSDGLFHYPCEGLANIETAKDLDNVTAIEKDSRWIKEQVDLIRRIREIREDSHYIYNMFAPSTLLRMFTGEEKYLALFKEDKDRMVKALDRLAIGLSRTIEAVIVDGGADGVFYSVQNQNREEMSDAQYRQYITPSDHKALAVANGLADMNILHICGYLGRRNNLGEFTDYNAAALNWASHVEKVSLKDGKKLFGNRGVIGGFDNTVNSVIYSGTKEEIEQYTEDILAETGRVGLVVGADCSLPFDQDIQRLVWVREKLASL